MIIRDLTYKGVSLSDTLAGTTRIVIQSVDKDVKLRTAVFDRTNYHGATSSLTLASGRLFTVSGVIFGVTREERAAGQQVLNAIIAPESSPSSSNLGFYPLKWKDDSGNVMEASAKVYSMPQYRHDNGSSLIAFTFELYSEEAYYTSDADQSATGWYGSLGGVVLPVILPAALSALIGEFTVENTGNFAAPCKIEVVGGITAPVIRNLTESKFYGVSTATTDFVLDTRGTSAIVTDAGADVSAYRMSGSKYVSVLPGTNVFLLTGSDFSIGAPVTVTVTYRDTFISS